VVAYHICSWFPGEYDTGEKHEWTRVKKRGDKTGNPNILHIFNGERADQYRGVPFLAPVIETLKQITRYTEAEIMAALVNSMFVIFITTESGNAMEGFKGEDEVDEDDRGEDDEIEIGTGTVNELRSGEKVNAVESSHPNGNFDSFVNAMAVQVGAALEIAPEILLKKFTKNFSASKGAMNETWKSYRMRRSWFVNDFCQEIYELWFAEAVSKGRIVAPGFFHDPLVRKAYTNCTWNGPAQGQLDPGKEVDAAIKRVKEGFSTHEDECTALNGSDFEDNVRTLEEENRLLSEANREME
jgi:lambda family phage portal protein